MSPTSELGGRSVDSIIFVDVDGVLNIGVADPGNRSLDMTEHNVKVARKALSHVDRLSASDIACLRRLLATEAREVGGGESLRYGSLTSSPDNGLCDLLVRRLADLLRAAGPGRLVVLSSTWRCPQYAKRVLKLESAISAHLGSPFQFDARTQVDKSGRDNGDPATRIQDIGKFLRSHCANRCAATEPPLRVLVLDDFNASPLQGLACDDGSAIDSAGDLKEYLRRQIPAGVQAKVAVAHTLASWFDEPSGLEVSIGCGLTGQRFTSALDFLQEGTEDEGTRALPPPPEQPTSSGLQLPGKENVAAVVGAMRAEEATTMLRLLQLFKHLHICTIGAHVLSRRPSKADDAKEDADGFVRRDQAAATIRVMAGA
jgi:hypothetical protein